jgi:SAM-dependent methyltransferase
MSLPSELDARVLSEGEAVNAAQSEPATAPAAPLARLRRDARLRVRKAVRRVFREEFDQLDELAVRADDPTAHRSAVAMAAEISRIRQEGTNTATNLESLKAEFRSLLGRVEALGFALAPSAGLDAAGDRYSELREAVHVLERRVRRLDTAVTLSGAPLLSPSEQSPGNSTSAGGLDGGTTTAPPGSVFSELFDYVGFERRFRGDPADILAQQRERYGELLASTGGPVVDIGCGRGELMEVLHKAGVPVVGVDTDHGMVSEAQARGLDVRLSDAIDFLASVKPKSVGAVFLGQVVEHLEFESVLRLVDLAREALQPGGALIMETPNPATLVVLGNSFILDPTHTRPIHPSLLAFVCESAGFRSVEVRFYSRADGYRLKELPPSRPEWAAVVDANTEKLNDVLFGAQDYAVIARTAPEGAVSSAPLAPRART